uniref:CCHC-type domain-containing protein n=1 Tax=Trichogramma kaykai TaxID=54128 RepID=A0ABD2WAG1_9HYME
MCFNCGEEQHPNENCKCRTPARANCKADPLINPEDVHRMSISSKCPKVQEQKKINIVMAHDNLSFSQAKTSFAPSKTSPNSVNKTQENYPVLMNNNRTMGKTA